MFFMNFNDFNKKENANKFVVFGFIMLCLGFASFIFKDMGVRIISYSVAILFLFFAYLNGMNINDRRRYQLSTEIKPYLILEGVLITVSILFFVFPTKIQEISSVIIGSSMLISNVRNYISNKDNPYYTIGFSKILSFIFSLVLIFSPLFLTKFLLSIFSFVIITIGINLFSFGMKMRRY